MDFKKFAKYAYMLLMLLALVFTFVPAPTAAWAFWIIALLGIFIGVFGKGVDKALDLTILYFGLKYSHDVLDNLNFVGPFITKFLGNMVYFMGPLVLTIICYKLYKLYKE